MSSIKDASGPISKEAAERIAKMALAAARTEAKIIIENLGAKYLDYPVQQAIERELDALVKRLREEAGGSEQEHWWDFIVRTIRDHPVTEG